MKEGKPCQGCLPQRLGNCTNATSPQPESSTSSETLLNESTNSNTTTIDDATSCLSTDNAGNTTLNVNAPLVWPPPKSQPPTFTWGECRGELFCEKINTAYDEVMHWRRNVFQVPSGSSGKTFVSELARLFQAYADCSSLESIAMKATSVMQTLLLQKPSRTSKSRDHVKPLQRRLNMWTNGDIDALLEEGKCIQKHLRNAYPAKTNETIARKFRDLMLQGKVQSVLRYLSQNTNGGVLKLEDLIPETTQLRW